MVAAQKSLRVFLSCFFTRKGPQRKTAAEENGMVDYKSNTPKHKSKDRQIAQGDYEQERAK